MATSVARRSVKVIMLGRMGFMPAFDIQTRYARQHLDEMAGKANAQGEDTLLLVEHSPVYTVGIRNKDYTQTDVTRLKAKGAEFYTTNRGGLITFHGPGQLVAYPILNLTRFKPSMKWYVSQLEQTLLGTLRQYGLTGQLTDQTGVWVDNRKIGSIGLHGSRYVTTHGVSLNCNTDLSWFDYIIPCGLKGVEMTSLTKELKVDVPAPDVTKPFLRSFQEVFDCDLEYSMLEKEDQALLDNAEKSTGSSTMSTASSTPSESVNTQRAADQKMEIGMRLMSTLSSSVLSSSSSSSSSTPSSMPSSTSSMPSLTLSTSLSPALYEKYKTETQRRVDLLQPNIIARRGPMW